MKLPKKLEQIVLELTAITTFSMFGCSKNPVIPEEVHKEPEYSEVQVEESNEQGNVIFQKEEGGIINVTVKDYENQPLSGIDVICEDNEDSYVFLTNDSEKNDPNNQYSNSFNILKKNSNNYLIKMKKLETNLDFFVEALPDSVFEDFFNYIIPKISPCGLFNIGYIQTVDGEYLVDFLSDNFNMAFWIADNFGAPEVKYASWLGDILNFGGLLDRLEMGVKDHRWDMHSLGLFDMFFGLGGFPVRFFIESNEPSVNIEDIVSTENTISVNCLAEDKKNYPFLNFRDPTVFCLGETEGCDLDYYYKLDEKEWVYLGKRGEGSSNFEMGKPSIGEHNLAVKVIDEVDNVSNISENSFFINPSSNFNIEEVYFINFCSSIQDLVEVNGNLCFCDSVSDKIYKMKINSNSLDLISEYNSPCGNAAGLTYNPNTHTFWIGDFITNNLFEMDGGMNVLKMVPGSAIEYPYLSFTNISDLTYYTRETGYPTQDSFVGGTWYGGGIFSYFNLDPNKIISVGGDQVLPCIPPKAIAAHNGDLYVSGNEKLYKYSNPPEDLILVESYDFPDVDGLDWNNPNHLWSCKDNKIYLHNIE